MTRERVRPSYRLALTVLAVGAGCLLVGYAMPWATATIPLAVGVDAATRSVEFTGRALLPGAAVAGWVCLAGIAGVLATRSWGRALVGGVIGVAGLAGVVGAVVFAAVPSVLVDDAVRAEVGGAVGAPSAATGWWALAALGGALAAYAGAATVVSGRRWPTLGTRYERSSRRAPAVSAWDAQDKGQDPTDDLIR